MTRPLASVVVAAFAATLMSLAPFDTLANARSGVHGAATHFHPAGHRGRAAHHHRAINRWPFYGEIATTPYAFDDAMTASPPETVVFVREMPDALSCQASQQIVTVPSEDGGVRQITIRRC